MLPPHCVTASSRSEMVLFGSCRIFDDNILDPREMKAKRERRI